MTDHLEPYRRMARSLRFVPPQWQAERFYRALTQVSTGTPTFAASGLTVPITPGFSAPTSNSDPGPTPDPSEYTATLIRNAVSKPTVIATSYNIAENIGDRISKLAEPQPRTAIAPLPKLPEPDPNWIPAPEVVAVQPEPIVEPVAFSSAVSDSETKLPIAIPVPVPTEALVEANAPVPAIASEPNSSNISDLEIVISTAEPTTRLEISQPTVSPTMGALETSPATASKATKRSSRKQAQGFSPSKKQRKA